MYLETKLCGNIVNWISKYSEYSRTSSFTVVDMNTLCSYSGGKERICAVYCHKYMDFTQNFMQFTVWYCLKLFISVPLSALCSVQYWCLECGPTLLFEPNVRCTAHGPFFMRPRYFKFTLSSCMCIIESVDSISRDGPDCPDITYM